MKKKFIATALLVTVSITYSAIATKSNDANAQADYTSKAKQLTEQIGPTTAKKIYDDAFYSYLSRGGHGQPNVESAHREAVKALATAPERYAEIDIQ